MNENKDIKSKSTSQTSSPLGVRGNSPLNVKSSMFHGASNLIFENARLLRENQTEAETVLWNILKEYKKNGFKFRRQHPIGNYISDFYCHKAKVIIEVDGGYHNTKEQIEKDKFRTMFFNEIGLQEIRFSNNQILFDIDNVLIEINNFIGLTNGK